MLPGLLLAALVVAQPEIRLGDDSSRVAGASIALSGATIDITTTPQMFVFVAYEKPEATISRVYFFIDENKESGSVYHSEGQAPYDMAGTDLSSGRAHPYQTNQLSVGRHFIEVLIEYNDGTASVTLTSNFVVAGGSTAPTDVYRLIVSDSRDRQDPRPLESAVLMDEAFITLVPSTNVVNVAFFMDPTVPLGNPDRVERTPPYDFRGGSPLSPTPLDTSDLTEGSHTLRAVVTTNTGVVVATSDFTVRNGGARLLLDTTTFDFQYLIGSSPPAARALRITSSDGTAVPFTVELGTLPSWLQLSNGGTTPTSINVSISPNGLASGSYNTAVRVVHGLDNTTVTFEVSLTVRDAASGSSYQLMVATNADRSDAVPLAGRVLFNEAVYVYVTPETSIQRVEFYLNQVGPTPIQTENHAPYDFTGGEPWDLMNAVDGANTIFARITKTGEPQEDIFASFSVDLPLPPGSKFELSPNPVTAEVNLGSSHQFALLVGLSFIANDGVDIPFTLSSSSPWIQFAAGSSNAPSIRDVTLNTAGLAAGVFTSEIVVSSPTLNTARVSVTITVVDPSILLLTVDRSGITSTTNLGDTAPIEEVVNVGVSPVASGAATFSSTASEAWVTVRGGVGTTPGAATIVMDPTGLAAGRHSATVTFQSPTHVSSTVTISLVVIGNDRCSPVICSEIRVTLPFQLTFDSDAGHLLDKNGVGTGMRHILSPPGSQSGYIPENIEVDRANGHLLIKTTAGIHHMDVNNADNNIGVGFAGPNQVTVVEATLVNPGAVTVTGNFEQAGLYFGYNQDNVGKLVFVSTNSGTQVEFNLEVNGEISERFATPISLTPTQDLTLELTIDPFARFIQARYAIDDGSFLTLGKTTEVVPAEFYSFDAAGIDPVIGTRSFVGVWGTHRNGPAQLTYAFSKFVVREGLATQEPATFDFIRKSHSSGPAFFPTSMAFGPDGRLYVTHLFGTVHVLTYDDDLNVIDDEEVTSLIDSSGGPRMTLGITIDPRSTATDVTFYLCHSGPQVNNGALNSGRVTKVGGPGFVEVEDILTGLPRAIANHAPNSLHFGSDDRLYVVIGGNTGAGSVTAERTEFGDRPEQPLSAAILVADIRRPGFDGDCYKASDGEDPLLGDPKCDVEVFATGLRNSYDFVFHSNGNMYATDNGLGVTGAFPPKPTPTCHGLSNTDMVDQGGNNPGEQTDLLFKVEEGRYYGHPNPSRDECVFKDGSLQGVAPLPNYQASIGDLGAHASANGIIEYKGEHGCGQLKGSLLYTRYSAGDDVRVVKLSNDGERVEGITTLVGGFVDPLTLAQNSDGDIFVAENGKVTSLRIITGNCGDANSPDTKAWHDLQDLPEALLDPASAAVGSDLFVIGGKRGNSHFNVAYAFNTETNTWRTIAPKLGLPVENAAAVGYNGLVYVFGGSQQAFSNAVSEAFVYDPNADNWAALQNMPTARGGAVAEVVGDEIYVIGGMLNGASVTTVEIYKPSTNTWRTGVPLQEVRDNPGAEVIDGKIYVIGGRHREDRREVDGTLTTCEVYDPAVQTWTYFRAMPTGRRTMVTGVLDGAIYVIGGERNAASQNELFNVNERYNPATDSWDSLNTPPNARHGAAYSVIENRLYVAGGGLEAGSSATPKVEGYY